MSYKCLEILLHKATAPKNCTLGDLFIFNNFQEKSHANGEYCKHSRILFNCCRCGTVN
jgi:hypothetical protein